MIPRSPLRLAAACALTAVSGPLLAAEKAPTYAVKVVDANGAPLAGVTVEAFAFESDSWRSVLKARSLTKGTTTADGRFSCEAPTSYLPNMVVVLARKKGLGLDWANWGTRASGEFTLTLTKGVVLGGTVVDRVGKPVAGAEVRPILFLRGGRMHRRVLPVVSPIDLLVARTDAKGRFRFAGVPKAARAEFTVVAKGKAKTFTLKSRAPQFTVGQTSIQLTVADEAKVSGSAVDKTGRPVAGVRVTVRAAGTERPFFFDEAVTGADGTFTIGRLPAGKLAVITLGPKLGLGKWVRTGAEVEAEAGKTSSGITLTVISGGVLEVSVREANTGVPLGGVSVGLRRKGGPGPSFLRRLSIRTGKDGIARVRLAPGKYSSLWIPTTGLYEHYSADEPFEIADGKTRKVQVKLERLAVLKGVVRDVANKPVKGAEVIVLPSDLAWPPYGPAIETDGKGRFKFHFHLGERERRDPIGTVVARIAARNLIAAAEIGDVKTLVEIKLAPGAQITGLVTDPEGKPIAGAKVRASLGVGAQWTFALRITAVTDGKGRYVFPAMLPDAEYRIRAAADGYGRANITGDIPEKPKAPVQVEKIVLKPANLSISGVVLDADGKPAVGVVVRASGEGQPDSDKSATTDKKGKFKVVKLCKGEVRLRARGKDGSRGSIDTVAGKTDIEIHLEPRRSIRPTQ